MEEMNYAVIKKKKINWKVIVVLIPIIILIIIVITANIKLHNEKKAFVEQAKNDLSKIAAAYNEDDYSSAMSYLKSYKENYSPDSSTYVSKLHENLHASTVSDEYETKIATKLYNKYKDLNEKYYNIPVTGTSDDEFNGVSELLNTMYDLISYFPDGFSYEDSTNTKMKFNDMKALKNDYDNLCVTQAIAYFNKGDKGKALSSIKTVLNSDGLSDDVKNRAQTCYDNMLPRCVATDFEILSGSKEISVFKSGKNYAWKCPYCGYINQAVGSSSIFAEMNNHYIGEVSTIPGMMHCPSLTGCGKLSNYTLKIKWE